MGCHSLLQGIFPTPKPPPYNSQPWTFLLASGEASASAKIALFTQSFKYLECYFFPLSSSLQMNCPKLVYIWFDTCIHLIKPLWILSESPKYYLKNSKHLHDCSKVEFTSTKRSHGLYSLRNIQGRILEWVSFPFSRGSSQPRIWTGVSCIAGWLFTNLANQGSP